jgi:hypothetical protein
MIGLPRVFFSSACNFVQHKQRSPLSIESFRKDRIDAQIDRYVNIAESSIRCPNPCLCWAGVREVAVDRFM